MSTYNTGHFDSWINWYIDWCSSYSFASQSAHTLHIFYYFIVTDILIASNITLKRKKDFLKPFIRF